MKRNRVFGLIAIMTVASLAVIGCATLGVSPTAPENQRALEGASIAMGVEYFTNIRHQNLSPGQTARALVTYGDAWLSKAYPEYTYLGLCKELSSELSKGRFSPDVMVLYGIILVALDEFGEDNEMSALDQAEYDARTAELATRQEIRQVVQQ